MDTRQDDLRDLLTVGEVCRLLPGRKPGQPLNRSTLYRWVLRGCRGVRLKLIKIGGLTRIRRSDLEEFVREVSRRRNSIERSEAPPIDEHAAREAGRQLNERGF